MTLDNPLTQCQTNTASGIFSVPVEAPKDDEKLFEILSLNPDAFVSNAEIAKAVTQVFRPDFDPGG